MDRRLSITADSVTLFGHNLLSIRDSAVFRRAFGAPGREREIKMHPSGTRIAMVWDDLGMVAYDDQPEGRMNHLHLAFDPGITPEKPSHPAPLIVDVNGVILSADTLERELPSEGIPPILHSFGRRFFIETASYVADFTFDQRKDAKGRKKGPRQLSMVSFTWKRYVMPATQ